MPSLGTIAYFWCLAFSLTGTMASKDGVRLGPNVRLPPTYDVQVLPSIPVRVNISVILFEIVSVNEPKQVQFKDKLN